jgi:hypothetical protein
MSFSESYQSWLGLVGGLIGIAIAVSTYFRGVIQQNAKIHSLELDINTVKTQFNVFWAVIEKELPKILIKPHTPEIDRLMRKLHTEGLDCKERDELEVKLRKALEDGLANNDSALAMGYIFMIARFESEKAIGR